MADTDNSGLELALAQALELASAAKVVGLGSGRASMAFIRSLGDRVKQGLRIQGVPTSQGSADLAQQLGIPLVALDQVDQIDVAVDGADEVDPQLNMIKGLGGALIREKIVAASSRRFVIIAGSEKWVEHLGDRGVLPVEVVPFALSFCRKRLEKLGCPGKPRHKDDKVFVTDNHNNILDCQISALANPRQLEQQILDIPGVVGTGLFLGMTDVVLIYEGANCKRLEKK